ncbi:MAG: zf-TFIIB domain-containing protein [Bdellovibrionales bacterium]|nr:zf-TFIIB domain-containing protein [Bdellovibrionales bacterium]
MNCVRCQTTLKTQKYEGVEIDVCPKCKGAWLDQGELGRIIDIHEEEFSPDLINRAIERTFTGIPKDEDASVELCPKCAKRMDVVNYAYNSGIIIDRCPAGHGFWFDRDELEKIQIGQENWEADMNKNKGAWVKHVKEVEAQSNVEVAMMKQCADHVPSNFLFNRLAGWLMKAFDND